MERERERDRERERAREGGREGEREGGREGGREERGESERERESEQFKSGTCVDLKTTAHDWHMKKTWTLEDLATWPEHVGSLEDTVEACAARREARIRRLLEKSRLGDRRPPTNISCETLEVIDFTVTPSDEKGMDFTVTANSPSSENL